MNYEGLYISGVRSLSALIALGALQSGPLPISKLAARTPVSRAAMTGTVDRLEKSGLVQRRPNEFDRRGVVVALTQKGESMLIQNG
tara:strand:- start:1580 stop:1837 length:258 start_codon:yes stop_codon:yes gene_type:complete